MFAFGVDFAHRFLNMRRIVYVCLYIYINIQISTIFYKNEGGRNLFIEIVNESFVSLFFKSGQCVSLHARVLSVLVDRVDQAVTGSSLRQLTPLFFRFNAVSTPFFPKIKGFCG